MGVLLFVKANTYPKRLTVNSDDGCACASIRSATPVQISGLVGTIFINFLLPSTGVTLRKTLVGLQITGVLL